MGIVRSSNRFGKQYYIFSQYRFKTQNYIFVLEEKFTFSMNSSFTLAIMLMVGCVFASPSLDVKSEKMENKTEHPTDRVRDGDIINPPHSMPWLVSIMFKGANWCTGSIIGRRHVLTAAHCYGPADFNKISVAVGAHDLNELGKVGKDVKIEKFEVFTNEGPKELSLEEFEYPKYDRDIAIITLAEDVLSDESLRVEQAALGWPSNTDCWDCTGTCSGTFDASGWGQDPINPKTQSFPKTTTKRCVDCAYVDESFQYAIDENKTTCAESDVNNLHHDVCHGDSGGPLTVAGTRIIVGIVMTGIHCADPGRRVGIYQDVLKPVVQCFIAEIVPELDFLCQDMK